MSAPRLLSGIGGSFSFLSSIKVASEQMHKRMSLAAGLLVTLAVFGGFIAQGPFAILVLHTSWRMGLRLLGFMGILILINILFSLNSSREKENNKKSISTLLNEIKSCVSNTQTFLSGFYISLMNFPISILGALWGALYLQETKHFPNIEASFVVSMLFIGVIVGSSLFPVLSESVFKNKKMPMLIGADF